MRRQKRPRICGVKGLGSMPRYRKSRRHVRRVETVAAPLFPGYVLVAIDMATQRWLSISTDHRGGHGWCGTAIDRPRFRRTQMMQGDFRKAIEPNGNDSCSGAR
jgi:hypothetical protein